MSIALVVTRGYSNGTLAGSIADVVRRGYGAGVAVVEPTGGGVDLALLAELERQRRFNRQERARREAVEVAALGKREAKRRVKRVFRLVSREPPSPELVERILPFAPNLAGTLAFPPEEAVKFDQLIRDLPALIALHDALLEAREARIADEEAALLVILMAT